MRKKFVFVASSLVMGFFLLTSVNTARGDSNTMLINILIKKGILTKEEAEALKKEVVEEEQKQQLAQKANEEAIEAAKQVPEWTKNVEVGYNNGAYIKTKDDRWLLKMNVGVEPEYIYSMPDNGNDSGTFKMRRVRLWMTGNGFEPWLQYFTQFSFEGSSPALRDAYLQATKLDYLQPRFGQYKVPFDREYLDSGFALPFVERSIASDAFSLQRDIGFQLAGNLLEKRVTYAAGMFNGSGANQSNVNNKYMYVGRVVWQPFGPYPYAQPPLGTKQDPLFALGAAGAYMPGLAPGERKTFAGPLGNTQIVPVTSDVYELTSDVAFRYKRFWLGGGYYFRNIDPQELTGIYRSTDAWGMYAQAGFFIIPDKFEFAGRYSYVDPDNPTGKGTNPQYELTFGLNYYFYGQRIKAQLNYSYFRTEADPSDLTDQNIAFVVVFLF
jgi:phosphate-selective porin OprO/OprP